MTINPEPRAPAVRIAVAALVRDDRILLVHRNPYRENLPDCWDLPGGHVEDGENFEAAVRRECHEELGIEIHEAREIPLQGSHPALDKRAFVVTSWSGTPENLALDEHDDLAWFGIDELPTLAVAAPANVPGLRQLLTRPD